jgi:hypothetical protein
MPLTVEELAIYGLIDADTYIRLTEAIMAGTSEASVVRLRLNAKACRRLRQRAQMLWQQTRGAYEP